MLKVDIPLGVVLIICSLTVNATIRLRLVKQHVSNHLGQIYAKYV